MPNCWTIDPLVTPYVDGELPAADREVVELHLRACRPCRARVMSEQAVRDLVTTRKPSLKTSCAPAALRTRCQQSVARDKAAAARSRIFLPGRLPLRPLALAATLVLIVGAAFIYPLTESSSRVLAAELALDHMKCFMLNGALGTHHTVDTVESSLVSAFGWQPNLPDRPEQAGLELVGERTCVYGEGRVAHVMYRQNGRPVSIFMLPDDGRAEETLNVLGHRAAIWTVGSRTFVLVSRGSAEEVDRAAAFVQASLR